MFTFVSSLESRQGQGLKLLFEFISGRFVSILYLCLIIIFPFFLVIFEVPILKDLFG